MTRSDDLAAQAEDERAGHEHRTAAAHAVRDLIRSGSGAPSASIVNALIRRREKRLDGTQMTTRDTTPEKRRTTSNHNDDITSNYVPLSGRED